MGVKVIVLVVVYNKFLNNSETINSFAHKKDHFDDFFEEQLIIWDNSVDVTYREANNKFCEKNNYIYLSANENTSLSIVYNKVENSYRYDYLLISDDDSVYNTRYFEELCQFIKSNEYVAVPLIYSSKLLRSPAKMGIIVGKHIKNLSSGIQHGLIAITSGMVISSKLKDVKYPFFDENLSFYGIDTDFFCALLKLKVPIFVMDATIEHDLSMYSKKTKLNESKEKKFFRYQNSKKATIYINFKRSLLQGFLAKVYFIIYEIIVKFKLK
ncbi:glycosyltransferase [Xenorhabdus khoisanae]|uniref:glycosyltransferase n=1 Tax=Xenorhabdus khoisanae TaxID=880157 RepID=UPI0032B785EA